MGHSGGDLPPEIAEKMVVAVRIKEYREFAVPLQKGDDGIECPLGVRRVVEDPHGVHRIERVLPEGQAKKIRLDDMDVFPPSDIPMGDVDRETQIHSDDLTTPSGCDFGKPAGADTDVQYEFPVQVIRPPSGPP